MRTAKKIGIALVGIIFYAIIAAIQKNPSYAEITAPNTASLPHNSVALVLGNPSETLAHLPAEENYLLVKNGYVLSYNNVKHIPNWAAWHLSVTDLGGAKRSRYFYADATLPEEWYAVKHNDYRFTEFGFERGHLCPSADRTSSRAANDETFLMTNIVPQSPDSNGGAWAALEAYERLLVQNGNEAYLYAGGVGQGGTGAQGTFREIPLTERSDSIAVPEYLWKILLILTEGEDDASRITADTSVIAVLIPNSQRISKEWRHFIVSVDDIEAATGYDFFSVLPDDIESVLEQRRFVP